MPVVFVGGGVAETIYITTVLSAPESFSVAQTSTGRRSRRPGKQATAPSRPEAGSFCRKHRRAGNLSSRPGCRYSRHRRRPGEFAGGSGIVARSREKLGGRCRAHQRYETDYGSRCRRAAGLAGIGGSRPLADVTKVAGRSRCSPACQQSTRHGPPSLPASAGSLAGMEAVDSCAAGLPRRRAVVTRSARNVAGVGPARSGDAVV